jgi:shikimate kinase
MLYRICKYSPPVLIRQNVKLTPLEPRKEMNAVPAEGSPTGKAMAPHASGHASRPLSGVMSALADALGGRSVALVGMMGAGKSSIGRKLAARLNLPFADADAEIEKAAGMTIPDIFAKHGEPYFRSGETRVIARLLEEGPQVLATGGGAFMNPDTRARMREKAVTLWLKADFDVLFKRIRRRNDRPMLDTADPAETLRALIALRDPVYAEADVTVLSRDVPHDVIIGELLDALARHLNPRQDAPSPSATPQELES